MRWRVLLTPPRLLFTIPSLAAMATAGCAGVIDHLGSAPAESRYVADHAFAAFAYRFFNVQRDAQFLRARTLMGQYALIPSRLYRDSTLWTASGDSSRTLHVRGEFQDSAFRFFADRGAPNPAQLSHQRNGMTLRWLGGGDYAWDLMVHHAVGPVTPEAIAGAILAALTGAEGRTGADALTTSRNLFPRTGRVLDELLDLDSLRTVPGPDGTRVTLGITVRPDQLRPRYPNLAAYAERYLMPTVYRVRLTDRGNRVFIDATGRDGSLIVRLRAHQGRLVALNGPSHPLPDSLRIHMDLSMKYRIFRVGFTDLVGDFIIERSPHRRAWAMQFTREPAWHFPLAVDRLIRNPLRRPFQGRGVEFVLSVRDDMGPQTISERRTRITVNESAIMRWLGRLGASAFSEFTGATEVEENRLLYAAFAALREDVKQ